MDVNGILIFLAVGVLLYFPFYAFFYWLFGIVEQLINLAKNKGPELAKLQKVKAEKELAKIDFHVLEATEAVMQIRVKAKPSNRGR